MFIILLQSGLKTIFIFDYQIRKDFIAATFCENKMDTELNCQGKCYLQKKIKAQENSETNHLVLIKGNDKVNLFIHTIFSSSFSQNIPIILIFSFQEIEKFYPTVTKSIFQPPQFIYST